MPDSLKRIMRRDRAAAKTRKKMRAMVSFSCAVEDWINRQPSGERDALLRKTLDHLRAGNLDRVVDQMIADGHGSSAPLQELGER